MSTADLKVRISTNADAFDSGLKKMQKSFDRTMRKMDRVGKDLTRKLTVPILAIGAAAGKAVIDFEDAFSGVEKTVDATESEFAQLRKGIIDMTKRLPKSAGEIASVAEAAGQLGIQTDAILEFSETMVMLGDSTNLTADIAASSFARIANIMNIPQDKFDEMGSTVVELGNNFATTEDEITEMSTRLAAAGNIAGFAASDIFGIATALSSVGVRAESGGTAAQKGILAINDAVASGNKDLQVFAETAGMTSKNFQELWRKDAATAFTRFVNGLGRAGDNATNILSQVGLNSERTRTAFLSLAGAGDLLNRTIETGRTAWQENTALTDEAAKKYDNVSSRLKMLGNRFIAFGLSFSDIIIPAINKGIDIVDRITDKFESFSDKTRRKILVVAGVLAAGGPLMVAIAAVGSAFSTLMAVGGPILGLVAGIGLAATAILKNWDAVEAYFTTGDGAQMWTDLKEIVSAVAAGITELWEKFGDDLMKITETSFGAILKIITTTLSQINSNIKFWAKIYKGDFKGAFDEVEKQTESHVESMLGFFEKVGRGIGDATLSMSQWMVSAMGFETIDTGKWQSFADVVDDLGMSFLMLNQQMERTAKIQPPSASAGTGSGGSVGGTGPGFGPGIGFAEGITGASFEMGMARREMVALNSLAAQLSNVDFGHRLSAQADEMSGGMQVAHEIAMNFTNSFGQGMANVVVQGERLVDVLKNIGKLLLSSAIQKGISLLLTGGLSGATGFFGKGGGLFGKLFGRDIGGPVSAGTPYLIGKGPQQEIFVPNRAGTVVPNSRIRGGGAGGGITPAALVSALSQVRWKMDVDKGQIYAAGLQGGMRVNR